MAVTEVYKGVNVAATVEKVYLGANLIYTRGASYDAATQALLDQAALDGYTAASGTTLTALDTFITTLKSAGIWDLLDVVWLPATNGDSDFACYNLKDPSQFKLTKVNSPTFTSLQGFTGNGSSSYLNTNWNPVSNGVNYVQNSASLGAYIRSLTTVKDTSYIGAVNTSVNSFSQVGYLSTNRHFSRINNGTPTTANIASTSTGLIWGNRLDSSNFNLYTNSTLSNSASSSSLITNLTFYISAANVNGTALGFNNAQISFAFAGASLNAHATNLYNAIQTYMESLYDSSTQALLDQATIDGYTPASGTALTALDTFIKTLKNDGIWDLIDVMWLPATNGDSDFACYNLKNPATFKLTKVNSPTFTSLQGFTGNGSSSYLNTNWKPATNGVNYQLNSASIATYLRTHGRINSRRDYGTYTSFTQRIESIYFSNNFFGRLNLIDATNNLTYSAPTSADLIGMIHMNRSGVNSTSVYHRTTLKDTDTTSSGTLPTHDFYIGCYNNAGTPDLFSSNQVSFFLLGGSLNSSLNTSLYNAIQTYMTALGTQV